MSDQQPPIEIHHNEPTPEHELIHPCLAGVHMWAFLTAGGMECVICGRRR